MHFLLILIFFALIFPILARVVGGLLKSFVWLILVLLALAGVGAIVH